MLVKQCASCAAVTMAAALALTGCAATVERGAVKTPPPQLGAVRQRLVAECAAGSFSGVVAVEQSGKLLFLHACGWADANREVPLGPAAQFRLFSLTKVFTATAIMRLVERRRMDLDAPLSKYLMPLPNQWSEVTIRNLLQHQSGIPDYSEKLLEAYQSGGSRSHSAAMRHVLSSLTAADAALNIAPGRQWRYSNFGYELLAAAAVSVERRPFHQIVQKHVFRPGSMATAVLELADPTSDALTAVPIPGLVAGFNGSARQPVPVETIYSFVQQGAGAGVAAYADLLAFTRALHHGKLIRPATMARNENESVPASDTVRYGFGWMIRETGACTYWQHSGGTNGYASDLAYAPQSALTIVVVSNLGFGNASSYRRDLAEALLGEKSSADRPNKPC